jgi:hypothetical protein
MRRDVHCSRLRPGRQWVRGYQGVRGEHLRQQALHRRAVRMLDQQFDVEIPERFNGDVGYQNCPNARGIDREF